MSDEMRTVYRIDAADCNALVPARRKVAAYCRVSTGSDAQINSLNAQKEHYEKLIRSNPEWEFAGLFFDEAVSGTSTDGRYGLLDLLSACSAGKIDHVIVKSISRFARNTLDCISIVRDLLAKGVSVYFEKENIDTSRMDSEFVFSALAAFAEDESRSISENCRWTCRRKFRDGSYRIGYPPYGYDVRGGVFSINEGEAEVVRMIFSDYLSGIGTGRISARLNELGISPRRSGKWSSGSVLAILKNEKYTGDCLFQKYYNDSSYRKRKNTGDRDSYLVENHHEAIISREDFKRAAEITEMTRRIHGGRDDQDCYRASYPFSGKIVCGECGSQYKRTLYNYNMRNPYVAWVCPRHARNSGACSATAIRNDAVEAAFCTMVNKLIWSSGFLLRPYVRSLGENRHLKGSPTIEAVRHELERNAMRKQSLSSLLAQGLIDAHVYAEEMSRLNYEASKLRQEQSFLLFEDGCGEGRETYRLLSGREMLESFDSGLFSAIVSRITVVSRSVLQFELKCGLSLKEDI